MKMGRVVTARQLWRVLWKHYPMLPEKAAQATLYLSLNQGFLEWRDEVPLLGDVADLPRKKHEWEDPDAYRRLLSILQGRIGDFPWGWHTMRLEMEHMERETAVVVYGRMLWIREMEDPSPCEEGHP